MAKRLWKCERGCDAPSVAMWGWDSHEEGAGPEGRLLPCTTTDQPAMETSDTGEKIYKAWRQIQQIIS